MSNAVTRWWNRRAAWQQNTLKLVGGSVLAVGATIGAVAVAPLLAPVIATALTEVGGGIVVRVVGVAAVSKVAEHAARKIPLSLAKGAMRRASPHLALR